jgi:uncharacterized protein (TIGR03118 family)
MPHITRRRLTIAAAVAVLGALVAAATTLAGVAGSNSYIVKNLVSNDGSQVNAPASDGTLVNGWGLSDGPTTPWWVSDNGTNNTTLYSGTGSKVALTVSVPGGPTGTVFNGSTTAFVVSQNGKSGAARFLFATEAGTILGWSPAVNGTTAIPGADLSSTGADFKGLTILNNQLYAADFHNSRVVVLDSSFQPVSLGAGAFRDSKIPKGWGPFGIQALGGNVFVTYARQDKTRKEELPGGGKGYVDEYSPTGQLLARVAKAGNKRAPLNAPWGLALAPAGFGAYGGALLVGNFGNGRISAYVPQSDGHFGYKGQLRNPDGSIIVIDGLWAIAFGNGSAAGPTTSLYFAAGPRGESAGAFGVVTAGG